MRRNAERLKTLGVQILSPIFALLVALTLCAALIRMVGESPSILLQSLRNTLFTGFGIGHTVFYATPLIFTGLSVSLCYRCGLFNIGAEGQLYLGALSATTVALGASWLPTWLAIPLLLAAAFAGGALWGGIAGFLKAKRDSHEVIVTILLNLIAYPLLNYAILHWLRAPESQGVETGLIPDAFQLPALENLPLPFGSALFQSTPANASIYFAILGAVACYVFFRFTIAGFEFESCGRNPVASAFAGISVRRVQFLALTMAGGLAGLVMLNDIAGYQHRLVNGFSAQYGFTGIAVALLAKNHPLAIIPSALLFGSLQNVARELEFMSEHLSQELAIVLQGVIVALVASPRVRVPKLSHLRRRLGEWKRAVRARHA